jgi:hypothetical protein
MKPSPTLRWRKISGDKEPVQVKPVGDLGTLEERDIGRVDEESRGYESDPTGNKGVAATILEQVEEWARFDRC